MEEMARSHCSCEKVRISPNSAWLYTSCSLEPRKSRDGGQKDQSLPLTQEHAAKRDIEDSAGD